MRPRLIVILSILVLTPLALLLWIAVRAVREEREAVERGIQTLHDDRLREPSSRMAELIERRERELQRACDTLALDTESLRDWVRRSAAAGQVFVLGADGKRQHPPPEGPLSDGEREFLARAEQVWRDRDRFFREPEAGSGAPSSLDLQGPSRRAASGWYVWYWGNDIHLVYWQRTDSGQVVGIELNRGRLIADIIAGLPSEDALTLEHRRDRIRLLDSTGEPLCQWGSHVPAEGEAPAATLQLAPPLTAWRLQYFSAVDPFAGALSRRFYLQSFLGLLAVGLVLVGLAVYFYRESSRELREAGRRVTFVNQVSHELKTPLTNIRMYGELLQASLREEEGKTRDHVDIIVSESRRLSRLIGNILTFARKGRGSLRLHRRPGVVDETIGTVIERFRPSLSTRGVEVRFVGSAPRRVSLDADALEQILNNLLSNVEKYAPDSEVVEVESRQDGTATSIVVADRGPGIPEKSAEDVFQPFRRLSDKLTDGVAGTGLGLSIARELARLHGGDVRLSPSERGARFEVTLETPGEPQ
ncbi:MAG TPA: HAMP domain-containing sensor histidine kinase [Planctomycetota bacterium]|nr:HAMP domain-containing sensor histidine kinase [Planctomycetota bacterium]